MSAVFVVELFAFQAEDMGFELFDPHFMGFGGAGYAVMA
jgi:hypothetical protein